MTEETDSGHVIFRQLVENPDLKAVRTLRRGLEAAGIESLPMETREAFSFFISETVTNLIEHTATPPNRITVELVTSMGAWICRVVDDGPTFEGFRTKLAIAYEDWNSKKGFKESGIGLALITKMLPDYWYEPAKERADKCNIFSVRYPARRSIVNKPRIMIVDDNETIRAMVRIVLQNDYQIRSYPDALMALEEFDDSPVDLVISDIRMPEMDGLAFRQALVDRGDDLIPFVFLTSESDVDVSRKADELAIDDYIVKPIDAQRLISTMRRLLLRRNSIQEKYIAKISRELSDTLNAELRPKIGVVSCAIEQRVPSAGGGDLVMPISDDGIIVADVMGHGLRAKMVAHAVSAYVRSQIALLGDDWSPGELMGGISNAICADDSLDSVIVTAALVRILPNGELLLCSAGHPMPILLSGGAYDYVEVGGPLLGLTPDQIYKESTCKLEQGMALVVMTDGLFEISPSSELQRLAEQRICAAGVEATSQALDAAAIAQKIISAYDDITKGEPTDDTTIIVIKH